MLKAIVFDIDNTLYSYDAAHAAAFRALIEYARANLGLTEEEFTALHREGDRLLRAHAGENCAAIHNRLLRYQLMLERLGKPLSHAVRMSGLYWGRLLEAMEPAPGAEETVKRLREAEFRVGVGTNMTADYQFAKLERLGLLDQIDFLVTSEEAGAEKPDGRLFALCAEKAGCAPSECAFVGDSLRHDALGAREAGMHPVWLCPGEEGEAPEGVRTIRSLRELPALLSALS